MAPGFDWTAWLDGERQAAERRTGSVGIDAVIADARYARVLDLYHRRGRAQAARAEADRALADTEREATAMAAEVTP